MPTILTVALVVLVVALVWLAVEVALTVRSARPCIDAFKKAADDLGPVVASAGEVVEQAKPVVAKLDAVLEQAQPAVVQVEPVLRQTAGAIGALSDDLVRLDAILGDVSRATNVAGNAASVVNDAAGNIAQRAKSAFGRRLGHRAEGLSEGGHASREADVTDGSACDSDADVQASCDEPLEAVPQIEVARKEAGYFTYPDND